MKPHRERTNQQTPRCGVCPQAILTTEAVAFAASERTFYHLRCRPQQGAHWLAPPARQTKPHGALPEVEAGT